MEILFISEYFYPRLCGGAERINWKILSALAKRGHNIHVITGRLNDMSTYEEINDIKIYRPISLKTNIPLIFSPFYRLWFAIQLHNFVKSFLKNIKVDVIFVSGYIAAVATNKRKASVPTIISIRSYCGQTWFKLANPATALFNYLSELLIIKHGQCNVFHCPSNEVAQRIACHTSTPIAVIPNPLNLEEIKYIKSKSNTELTRKQLCIEKSSLFLLAVGSLLAVKNIDGLIKVLKPVSRNYKLVVIGDGPERPKIEKLINRLKLEKFVMLLGQKSHAETLKIMAACDLFILSSRSETFSNVALEALAIGKPVIATKVGELLELQTENLYLVNRLEEITQKLEKTIKQKEDNGWIGKYSMNEVIQSFETLFNEILNFTGKKNGQ